MFVLGNPPAQRYSRPERSAFLPLRARPSRSRGVPCESLDAPDNLPKKSRRQVALRQLQDEVPGVTNEATTGLEQPLLEARQPGGGSRIAPLGVPAPRRGRAARRRRPRGQRR